MPENSAYVSRDQATAFGRHFTHFSVGPVVSDDAHAPSIKIGRPSDTYRRIAILSPFGPVRVLVTHGYPPYPYGREMTGDDVANPDATLAEVTHAGARVLVQPCTAARRRAAALQRWSFPEAPTVTQSLA